MQTQPTTIQPMATINTITPARLDSKMYSRSMTNFVESSVVDCVEDGNRLFLDVKTVPDGDSVPSPEIMLIIILTAE